MQLRHRRGSLRVQAVLNEGVVIPPGATHVGEFYGQTTYYRHTVSQRESFWIDDIIVDTAWYYWENDQWKDVGSGFSPRRLKSIS